MSTKPRLLLIACFGALILGVAVLWLAPTGSGRYVATSRVVVMPYTNAVLGPSFELGVVKKSRGVIRFRFFTSFSTRPTPTTPGITNGAGIEIVVSGATSVEARQLANEAAVTLCASARQLFGGNALVVDLANRARPYSPFHDSVMPGVERLFTH